jgi:hypothetical protein
LLRIDEEAPPKDQKIALLEQPVSNLEKENDLLKQQNRHPAKSRQILLRERLKSIGSLLKKVVPSLEGQPKPYTPSLSIR